ncbi:hypothetical protein ONZ45_g7768 [Pleurotus djamor]|nr:hypothetical protein ONZ45_g7768 [Pleurotus djamor]
MLPDSDKPSSMLVDQGIPIADADERKPELQAISQTTKEDPSFSHEQPESLRNGAQSSTLPKTDESEISERWQRLVKLRSMRQQLEMDITMIIGDLQLWVDLRTVLDTCLAENAIPEDVEPHVPLAREIATKLLQDFDSAWAPDGVTFDDMDGDPVFTGDVVTDGVQDESVPAIGASSPAGPIAETALNSFGPNVSTGRHVHLVKGNDQSRPRPRPPHVLNESDLKHSH